MSSIFVISMIRVNKFVHKWCKKKIGVGWSGKYSHTNIWMLASSKNGISKIKSIFIFGIFQLIPNISGQAFRKMISSSSLEKRHFFNIFPWSKMFTTHCTFCSLIFFNTINSFICVFFLIYLWLIWSNKMFIYFYNLWILVFNLLKLFLNWFIWLLNLLILLLNFF